MRRWCPGTLKDVIGFDIPIVCNAEEVRYLRRLLRFLRNVDVTYEYRCLDLCCFEDPIDGFYSVNGAEAWWRELEFEGRQRHRARGLQLVGWHSLELFALSPSERNHFYTPVPHGKEHESNI